MRQSSKLHVPAIRSALLITTALALSGCSLLSRKEDRQDDSAVAAASGKPAFTLEVEAPKEVRDLLQKHLELKRFQHQSDLQRRELTRLLGATSANVRDLIGTLGYFSPTVTVEVKETPESEEAPRKVIVNVDPGPATTIKHSEVRFSGANAQDPEGKAQRDAIRDQWPLKPGEPFSQSQWSSAKSGGLKVLQARRYPTARIDTSLADVDADHNEASVGVTYDPGAAYTFGPLVIEGTERYDPVGLARIARLPEGKVYDQNVMLDTQQRLVSSGYFDSVFLALAETPKASLGDSEQKQQEARAEQGSDVTSPVIAKVREARLQKWVFGVGVSTDTGPRLSIDHIHNKVPGLNWRAVTKLQIDRKNPLISTQLTGLPGEDYWRNFVGAKLEREPVGDFDVNSAQLRAGRAKSEERIERNYYLQYDWAKTQGSGAPPASSSLLANYGWTGRYFDNNISPTSGYGFAWEAGVGTTLTPQRTPFTRVTGRWMTLMPLGKPDDETQRRSRLQLRAWGGAITAKSDADLPMTLMFLAGGDNSIRGYGYQSIGAKTDNGKVIGGRYLAAGSVEWQRPIVIKGNTQDFEQAVFVDAGTVGDDVNRMYARVGVGTGIRWRSPVGPLQADLAYGLQEHQLRLHLRLGFNF
ncbi:BamA/TamA family outer membrane protein [Diaphorobacter ruginosibacter]|uniref:Translocation and assembly module subunit TamA n=1 Tax=Diaphorobacter ruginosibacter TaxID=1715720 RepID=A0A7G9RLZ1_9BURK|nr:BamA/TamA family outer membrane protein [Diaphorobacter ruginosibacter]QNN56616.1 BamA/TamA family outer membrane protein [Diaphorobacter ruginosibacter]